MNGPSHAGSRDTTEPLDRRLGLLSRRAVLRFLKISPDPTKHWEFKRPIGETLYKNLG